ncbi:MAG: MBL fold metallo-hydrolase [Gammaproteobacteria bacterium]
MQLRIIATGSSGNCFLVRHDNTCILVDCGVALGNLNENLAQDGLEVSGLDAIFLTHEHSDHASELQSVSKAADCPVFLSSGTYQALKYPAGIATRCFDSLAEATVFKVGQLQATAIPCLHDAREPVCWIFAPESPNDPADSLGILTDTGSISKALIEAFSDCNMIAIEFNHDLQMLEQGPYSARLKQRVSSAHGHLNNEQASEFLTQILRRQGTETKLHSVLAVHISENNNSLDTVKACMERCLPANIHRRVMPQRQASEWLPQTPPSGH